MIRKQIYFTEELAREIKMLAKRKLQSEAEVIRELLNKGLSKKSKKMTGGELLARMAKRAGSGPADLSTNLDDYLYGDKSPKYGKKNTNRR